jgi:BirA family biotin operon repressor/biotin-[acetyl-CoA-carboxylase] ligase
MDAAQPTWNVQVVAETGSTNTDLLEAAAAGAAHGTVLRALHQTAGRGRLDRRWDAPPGANLLVSILFRSGADRPHRLTQRVAVAAAIACERVAGVSPTIKWPNDLQVDGAKLAGMLSQAGGRAGHVDYVVVGLGVNVSWAPPGAARLPDGVDPGVLLDALLAALDEIGDQHDAEYRRRLVTLGQRVRVDRHQDSVVGVAVTVLDDGRLVVRPDGAPDDASADEPIDTGDVVHLRPQAAS